MRPSAIAAFEATPSIESLATLNDAFERFAQRDPSRLDGTGGFLQAVDAAIRLDAVPAAGPVH